MSDNTKTSTTYAAQTTKINNGNVAVKQITVKKPLPEIIFPLKSKPINNFDQRFGANYNWTKNNNQTGFGTVRSKGIRKHAARDLYTKPYTEIVAICDGTVLQTSEFYSETNQITVKHKTKSGRQFIIRYGEVDPKSIKVKQGDFVKQGTVLAKTGFLHNKETKKPEVVKNGTIIYMLHFEYYSNVGELNLKKPLTDKSRLPFQRREDLLDPLEILIEGYRNTFGSEPK
ncbi:M23 family metallopeptidase [Gilliamella apicola]|uniref:M23 family metallopeptidase n=1 Tax=Gilliamella apicola TaxID=1196095 RepID=UPI00080E2051|nr:M23 family metallopeptidase [Gilliamella apicola]OCG12285.1 hypothetical protein A9G14_05090 [Gilliamella apicola]ORF43701.1 hypothetical protein B5800_13500 [Gilliamella apicola]ORF47205.1 hypothetical protein B5799_13390 [Gilliamella apicola]ORF49448.1 hypothetical protein B5803_10400 [Gilliamella apicola]ORF50965.1 hypothetical protein B5802_12030 [Gilliamella apicola]